MVYFLIPCHPGGEKMGLATDRTCLSLRKQRRLDFLDRRAVVVHFSVLPVSMVILVALSLAVQAIGDHAFFAQNVFFEWIEYYYEVMVRAVFIEYPMNIHSVALRFSGFGALCAYFLFCHALVFAYRRRKRWALFSIVLSCEFYIIHFFLWMIWRTMP